MSVKIENRYTTMYIEDNLIHDLLSKPSVVEHLKKVISSNMTYQAKRTTIRSILLQ